MKKILTFIVAIGFASPLFVFAQTENTQVVLTNLLQQLLNLYIQELAQLEAQLAALQAEVSSTIAIAPSAQTSTPNPIYIYVPSPTLSQIQNVTPTITTTTGIGTPDLNTVILPTVNQTSNPLIATVSPLGTSVQRERKSVDKFGYITLSTNNAGDVILNSLTITFSGNAIATSTAASTTYNSGNAGLPSNITLYDKNGNDVIDSDGANMSIDCISQSNCTMTWIFRKVGDAGVISIPANSSYSFLLRMNTLAGNATPIKKEGPENLTASIQNDGDIIFNGGSILPAGTAPLVINSVSYIAN